jgi:hypothetical protein
MAAVLKKNEKIFHLLSAEEGFPIDFNLRFLKCIIRRERGDLSTKKFLRFYKNYFRLYVAARGLKMGFSYP